MPIYHANNSGSVTLEYALTLPLVLFLFSCLIQFFWIATAKSDLEMAGALAAHALAARPGNPCYAWLGATLLLAPNSSGIRNLLPDQISRVLPPASGSRAGSNANPSSSLSAVATLAERALATLPLVRLRVRDQAGNIRHDIFLKGLGDLTQACRQAMPGRETDGYGFLEIVYLLPLRLPLTSSVFANVGDQTETWIDQLPLPLASDKLRLLSSKFFYHAVQP